MGTISFSRFRRNPGKILDEIAETDEPMTVIRADGRDVVILSAREFEARCAPSADGRSVARRDV